MEIIKQAPNQFYVGENSRDIQAEITFIQRGEDYIVINHTYVCQSLEGQGVGLELVSKVAEYARREHKKIIPLCSFARKVMSSHDEYKDVLA